MESPANNDRILTTGEVAQYCSVHFRTVIRWIEKGSLKAYRLPGGGNNRIKIDDFLDFLQTNNIPVPVDLLEKNSKILIVDDEKQQADMIQRILTQAGYETMMAHDGFQAGSLVATYKPALITLDLSMPKMDGFSVLKYIRQQASYQDLKIIVISALNDMKLQEAEEAGANRTLTKPFKKDQLLELIDGLIGTPAGRA